MSDIQSSPTCHRPPLPCLGIPCPGSHPRRAAPMSTRLSSARRRGRLLAATTALSVAGFGLASPALADTEAPEETASQSDAAAVATTSEPAAGDDVQPLVVTDGDIFISEIHYDNAGTDEGEAIEVEAPVGTDLTGWTLVLYNGSNGASYDTDPLPTRSATRVSSWSSTPRTGS